MKNVKIKKKYSLSAARAILLAEISRYLGKNNQIVNKENIVLNALLESEAFLLTADILTIFLENDDIETNVKDQLPISVIQFWQDIIILLQDVNMLEALILKLLTLVKNEQETEYKRHMGALWINTIAQGFVKLTVAQQMFCTLEHKLRKTNKAISQKALSLKVEEDINKNHLNLRNVLFLNISNTLPRFLTDIHFLTDIILNANIFTCKFISPLLQLVIPKLDADQNKHLLKLIQIYTQNGFNSKFDGLSNKINEEIFTIEDIIKLNSENNDELKRKEQLRKTTLADQNIRNDQWKLTHGKYKKVIYDNTNNIILFTLHIHEQFCFFSTILLDRMSDWYTTLANGLFTIFKTY